MFQSHSASLTRHRRAHRRHPHRRLVTEQLEYRLPLSANLDIAYSTFLEGVVTLDVDVDTDGSVYVTHRNQDVSPTMFVTKFTPGTNCTQDSQVCWRAELPSVVFATTTVHNGSVYVTGQAFDNFQSTPGALKEDNTPGQKREAFFVQLSADTGGLNYATRLGGNLGSGIAVDDTGAVYIAGRAGGDLGLPPTLRIGPGGKSDVLVAKVTPTGNLFDLEYLTVIGGSEEDDGRDIALINCGGGICAYVGGSSASSDFPLAGHVAGQDAFVIKVAADGSVAQDTNGNPISLFVGGSGDDFSGDLALDENNNIYLTGQTSSGDFPSNNGFDSTLDGAMDGFVTKVDASLNIVYSTLLGGNGDDRGFEIAIDGSDVYVTGRTSSTDAAIAPINDSDPQYDGRSLSGAKDAYVAIITNNPDGTPELSHFTYLGGGGEDVGSALAVGPDGVWVGGATASNDFPISSDALDDTLEPLKGQNASDPFVTKLSFTAPIPGITVSPSSGLVTDEGGATASFTVVLDTKPTALVTLDLFSSDLTEGELVGAVNDVLSLSFDSFNWDQPQTVTVRGINDALVDGDVDYDIITAAAISSDLAYNGLNPSDIAVINQDNDAPTMHVSDLDANTSVRNGRWNATVTITVIDVDGNPVANATVSGTWSGGANGSASCVTNASGQCSVTKKNLKQNISSMIFTVDDITHATNLYDPDSNGDPDGDSDGTEITILKP